MTKAAQLLMEEALALPPVERASMIEGLISSFDPHAREAIDLAWAREAEARIDAHDKGTLKSRPLKSFVAQVNRK
ncbi:MAG TPA: addiction module protein [Kiritimatiellia bacterium]|nr:addiction module protein [Kiritimatiellia bacterium]